MRAFNTLATAVAAATVLVGSVLADVDPIVIKGSKFFYQTNGTQFFIKGIAYQQDYAGGGGTEGTSGGSDKYVDPLADASGCARDIPYLLQLQTNTVRVYAIDPTANHDQCMSLLAAAGIYVIADLSAPGQSIVRSDPHWDDDLYSRYTSVVDAMAGYSNTLGFFAGNEVSNNNTNTDASAFVKAAVRDMKSYIKAKNYRTIGVGYATNDDAAIRVNMADYFNCGDAASAIDFWGYNIYSWCGDSSYQLSGYDVRTEEFSTYSVPVFFAEYGCNQVQPRKFTEVAALYGPKMSPVWSGGIVYMYFEETNDFGLVSVSGSSVSKMPDFNYLSSAIAAVNPTGVQADSYSPTNKAESCPPVSNDWQADSALPPTPNEELCSCMYNALVCVPSSSVNTNNIADLFGLVCGLGDNPCAGISANGTSGAYGAYGMCNPEQQMGWALNTYYEQQLAAGNGASACDFSGSATLQSAVDPTGTCAALISQASGGTGTVTSQPSGTGSSSGSGSGSTSTAAAVPGFSAMATLNLGFMQIALYMACALGTGAGMILL